MSIPASLGAQFVSVWDGGTEIETACIIDMASGVVTPEVAKDGIEDTVTTLDSQHVMIGSFSVNVVEDDEQNLVANVDELIVIAQFAAAMDELPSFVDLESFIKHSSKPTANTRITYQYRDASNWKDTNEVIFKGVITPEQIKMIEQSFLPDFEPSDFLPRQVGLRPLCPWTDSDNYDDDLDHMIHTLEFITIVDSPATDDQPVVDLANKFTAAIADGWDMVKYGNEHI